MIIISYDDGVYKYNNTIYIDSSSPQFLQNEMQNASPSSHGSKLAMQDLDLDGCEDLKY